MSASVRFMYNNLLARASITSSSHVEGFEAANVYDDYRWKEWLTSGAFEVTASNKVIYFDDGSGSASVNIPEDTYSADDLAAAIVAALNDPSSNWTCTYSASTGKFTVGRSSGTAVLELTETTNAAWDMLGYTGLVDDDVGTGTAADERRNHTSEFLIFDLITNQPAPKALLMTGDADVEFDWPTDARIRVRANSVNVWDAAPLDVDLTVEQFGAFQFFALDLDTAYRYWRVDFYDRTNADGPQFAVNQMYLGPYFEPADFNLNIGFDRELVDPKTTVESDSRSRYHRQRRKYWEYSNLTISNIEDEDRYTIERIVREVGTTVPFWISLDPDAAISESVGEFTKYVEFDGDFSSKHLLYKRFANSLAVREVV